LRGKEKVTLIKHEKKDPKDFFGMDSGMKAWQGGHFLYLLSTPCV
jgi:hypothetical protein